jgi:hypothetical protein
MNHVGPAVLVSTWQAMGESIDLQKTHRAIFAMLPITPRQLLQGEGRFARIGGFESEVEYMIAEGTADEEYVDLLLPKLPPVASLFSEESLAQLHEALAPVKSGSTLLTDMLTSVSEEEYEYDE